MSFDTIEKDFKKYDIASDEIQNLRLHLKLASILHDIGHPPFSHLGEKFLDKEEIYQEILKYNDILDIEKTFKDKDNKIVGKEHELLSCFVILRKFLKILFEIDKDIDLEFIFRCIIGNLYSDEKLWQRNICINILNSDSIDVDKLDYLMRDNHMTGEIAPKMDIKRLLACLSIKDKKMKYIAKAIPAVQSVVDSRDLLYLWVYHHHISIYTDYVVGQILTKCMDLFENKRGLFAEELDRKTFFSPQAISDSLITDDDVYAQLRKVYVLALDSKADDFNAKAIVQIFERKFLKTLWKTIYEYKDFENSLIEQKIISSYEKLKELISDKNKINIIRKNMAEKLNLSEAEIFIITKYNKFYNTNTETPIYLDLHGNDRKLAELLPQKNYDKFQELAFFVFVPENKKQEAKKKFL